jgi:proteasome lid subunit RPN8/RPN11
MTPIDIPPGLLAEIYASACASYPQECCGYLVGPRDGGAVDAVVACRNAQADGEHPLVPDRGAETGFVIAGPELFAFARSLGGARPARVVYHSHTHGRADLSDVDRALAVAPGGPVYPVQHLVVGVRDGRVTEAALYAWADAPGDYVEISRWTI